MSSSPYLTIHWLLLKFYRKRRFVIKALPGSVGYYGVQLGLTESYILIHLDYFGSSTNTELAQELSLDKSTISRHVESLKRQKYVLSERSDTDKRIRCVSITKTGMKILEELNRFGAQTMQESISRIEKKDLSRFVSYWKRYSDGLGASVLPVRENVHPITVEARRISKVMKFLGSNVLESELSRLEIEAISIVYDYNSQILLSELCELLPEDDSTVRRLVERLELRDLLIKEPYRSRNYSVNITKKGLAVYDQHAQKADRFLAHGLRKFSKKELSDYIELLNEAVLTEEESVFKIGKKQYLISPIDTSFHAQQAREFYIRTVVEKERLDLIPRQLFDSYKCAFCLWFNSQLEGVMEVQLEKDKAVLSLFAANSNRKTSEIFITTVMIYLRKILKLKFIYLPVESLAVNDMPFSLYTQEKRGRELKIALRNFKDQR